MVEVPEYLLERSRQRRAELSGGDAVSSSSADDGAGAAASSGSAVPSGVGAVPPSVAVSSQPAPSVQTAVAAAPTRPDPPYVKAAKNRKKMPVWAASVMVCLPFWAIFYVGMLEPPSSDELVLESRGAAVFSTCASCHGADGAGTATGRQLNDGEVLLTFPALEGFNGLAHHLSWVYLGTQGYRDLGLDHYGDPERPGGQRQIDSFASGMSGFSNLSLDDLLSVVYYERIFHGELDPDQAALEEAMLLALAADHPDLETGSPEEIAALLAVSAEAHGVGLEAGDGAVDTAVNVEAAAAGA